MRGVMNFLEKYRVWNCSFCLSAKWIESDAVLRASSADGILVDSAYAGAIDKGLKLPGVAVGFEAGCNLPLVTVDYHKIAQMAADHLLSRGFRRFAFFSGYGTIPGAEETGSIFQRNIEAAGCSFEWFQLPDDSFKREWPTGHAALVRWVKRLKKPIAVMAANDIVARDLALACRDAAIDVPRGIAILGTSDEETRCFLCKPFLSSIDMGARQAGYQAAELLSRLMKGEPRPARPIVVPPVRVIVRESTDIVAAADPHVVAAFKYIEENVARGPSVKGMLGQVKVGRRTLELAFRRHLGRTIHQEIVRAQLQRVMHLLVNSTFNIDQIAAECGMEYGNNLGAFFKKHTGLTPLQYRMAHRHSYK